MALLELAARWAREQTGPPPRLEVATVDHRMRSDSAAEARFVGRVAAERGLAHVTLEWTDPRPASGLQAAARAARYRLLAARARELGGRRPAIVTAHTEDDVAETLLMRLARGSGVDGLASMRREGPLFSDPAVTLLRPLLGVSKDRLLAVLEDGNMRWIEDPSNERPEFERVRVRRALPVLSEIGLGAPSVARSARRLLRARRALEAVAGQAFLRCVTSVHDGVFLLIDRRAFDREPEDIRLRVLALALRLFGGSAAPVRQSAIEHVLDGLMQAERIAATLGGCVLSAGRKAIRIYREPGRLNARDVELVAGATAVWDNRFRVGLLSGPVACELTSRGPLTVRALGTGTGLGEALRARSGAASEWPARAVATLPAFWRGPRLVAIPHLGALDVGLAGPRQDGHAVCTVAFQGFDAPKCAELDEEPGENRNPDED